MFTLFWLPSIRPFASATAYHMQIAMVPAHYVTHYSGNIRAVDFEDFLDTETADTVVELINVSHDKYYIKFCSGYITCSDENEGVIAFSHPDVDFSLWTFIQAGDGNILYNEKTNTCLGKTMQFDGVVNGYYMHVGVCDPDLQSKFMFVEAGPIKTYCIHDLVTGSVEYYPNPIKAAFDGLNDISATEIMEKTVEPSIIGMHGTTRNDQNFPFELKNLTPQSERVRNRTMEFMINIGHEQKVSKNRDATTKNYLARNSNEN